MSVLVTNNASTTLLAGVSSGDTTLTVPVGLGDLFPVIASPDVAYLTLEDAAGNIEVVKATARTSGADSITVVRGQDGTSALAWLAGDALGLRPTAAIINTLVAEIVGKEDTTNKGAANGYASLDASSKVQEVALQADSLSGVSASATELNYNDISTLGTVQAEKTVTADSSGDITNSAGEYKGDIVGNINDTNSNEIIKTAGVASAVNEITVTNAASGNKPSIDQTGAVTNLGIDVEGVELRNNVVTSDAVLTNSISAKTAASLVSLNAGSSVTGKQQGVLVMLDVPIAVALADTNINSWETGDITSISADAKIAVIHVTATAAGLGAGALVNHFARKGDSSAAIGYLYRKGEAQNTSGYDVIDIASPSTTYLSSEYHVPLDSSNAFDWYTQVSGHVGTPDTDLVCVGYYV